MSGERDHQPKLTTSEVRGAYIDRKDFEDQIGHVEPRGDEAAGAEFDRWLAERDAQVLRGAAATISERLLSEDDGPDADMALTLVMARVLAEAERLDGHHQHTWRSEAPSWLRCVQCGARLTQHHRAARLVARAPLPTPVAVTTCRHCGLTVPCDCEES